MTYFFEKIVHHIEKPISLKFQLPSLRVIKSKLDYQKWRFIDKWPYQFMVFFDFLIGHWRRSLLTVLENFFHSKYARLRKTLKIMPFWAGRIIWKSVIMEILSDKKFTFNLSVSFSGPPGYSFSFDFSGKNLLHKIDLNYQKQQKWVP